MARTVTQITEGIVGSLVTRLSLSDSKVAEWRLWINIVAIAIHTFELILDQFKVETELKILESRPGTEKWYEHLCYDFQYRHKLDYDPESGTMRYEEDDPDSRITAVAAVQESNGLIILRVAKKIEVDQLAPFGAHERQNFTDYINEVKFAGSRTSVISTTADQVMFDLTVYYNPAYPSELVESRVKTALVNFNLSQQFGGILYRARFLEAIMGVDCVTTAKLHSFRCKGTSDEDYQEVDISVRLEAGYFNYALEDFEKKIEYTSAHTLYNEET